MREARQGGYRGGGGGEVVGRRASGVRRHAVCVLQKSVRVCELCVRKKCKSR